MAQFDPTLSQPQGISTAVEPVAKHSSLPDYVQGLSSLLQTGALDKKSKSPAVSDSEIYKKAAIKRQEIESEYIADIDETERAVQAHPEMFEDGLVSAEEEKILVAEKRKVDRIMRMQSGTARKAALNRMGREFLNSFGEDVKPEVVDKVLKLYDIKTLDEPLVDRFGESVYKQTKEMFPNASPVHFLLVANRNRNIAQSEDFRRVTEDKFMRGELMGADIRNVFGGLFDSNANVELAGLHEELKSRGFVSEESKRAFLQSRQRDVDAIKSQIAQVIAEGSANGAVLKNAQELYDEVDRMAKPYQDFTALFGSDPSLNSRLKNLMESYGSVPELVAGVNLGKLVQVAAAGDLPLRTMLDLLTQGKDKANATLKQLGIPVLEHDDMIRAAQTITEATLNMVKMGPEQLPDPSQRALYEYLSSLWAGKKPPKGEAVPENAVKFTLDAIDKGSPGEVFFYLQSKPAFTTNAQASAQSERLVATVRNNLASVLDELDGKHIVKAADGKFAVYSGAPGATARGQYSGIDKGDVDVKLTEAVNAANAYLGTSAARNLLGSDDERNRLLTVLEPNKAVNSQKGATLEDIKIANGDLSKLSDSALLGLQSRLHRSTFDSAPGSTSGANLKAANARVEQALASRTQGNSSTMAEPAKTKAPARKAPQEFSLSEVPAPELRVPGDTVKKGGKTYTWTKAADGSMQWAYDE